LLFHAYPELFKAGYLGVDIFFVISGFVLAPRIREITISKNKRGATLDFFKQRFWRLTPALFVALITSMLLVVLLGGVGYIKDTFLQAFFTSIFLGNISAAFLLGDYFKPMPNPLLHTWSLSLEEQIYFFTPIAFILAMKFFSFLKVLHLYVIFGGLSFISSFLSPYLPYPLLLDQFYSPITRYWQFCVGALIFFLCERENLLDQSKVLNARLVRIFLFVLLFFLILVGPELFLFPLMLFVLFRKVMFFQLDQILPKFARGMLTSIGDRSYSIYLVHLPILWLFQFSPILQYIGVSHGNEFSVLLGLVVTFFCGNLLYKYVEVKFRSSDFRREIPPRALFRKTLTVAVTFFVLVGSGVFAESHNYGLQRTVLDRPLNQMDPVTGEKCDLMNGTLPCEFPSGSDRSGIVLIGDSHAGSLALSLKDIFHDKSNFTTFLHSGCQYVDQSLLSDIDSSKIGIDCARYSDKVKEFVQQVDIQLIVVSSRSTSLRPRDTSTTGYLELQIRSLIGLSQDCDCQIIVIGPTPEFPKNPHFFAMDRLLLAGNENAPRQVSREFMSQVPFRNDRLWNISFARLVQNDIHYLGAIDFFCNPTNCTRWRDGWLFSDDDHLSDLGAKFLLGKLEPQLQKLTKD
jgi:peptidoglycan/LPS O-acetylase OafA/YrhL